MNDRTHASNVRKTDPLSLVRVHADLSVPDSMKAVAKGLTKGVAILDGDARFTTWSRYASEVLGWSEADVLGRTAEHVFRVDEATPGQPWLFADGGCTSGETSTRLNVRHKDGTMVAVEIDVVPFRLRDAACLVLTISPTSTSAVENGLSEKQSSLVADGCDAMVVLDLDGNVQFANRTARRRFGDHVRNVNGGSVHAMFSFEAAINFSTIKNTLLRDCHWEGQLLCHLADGAQAPVLSCWKIEQNNAGQRIRILMPNAAAGLLKKHVQAWSHERRQDFDAIFRQHPDGVFSFDLQRRLVAVNPELCRLTGYQSQHLLDTPLSRLCNKAQLVALRTAFFDALHGQPQTAEFSCIRADGTEMDASITLLPNIVDHRIVGLHGILKDISQRKRDERHILYLANHDALTGLPNRHLLQDRMHHAIARARTHATKACVLFMDLNRFKVINDSLGHDKGDQLLCAIADRLKTSLREVDTVARIGGDEFVVLIENVRDIDEVARIAQALLARIAEPIQLGDMSLSVTTSIGASIYPTDGNNAVALLKHSDLAMYAAKGAGYGCLRFYSAEMNDKAMVRLTRETSLRRAIACGQLVLHYQPRLDIARNQIVGLEALVRWDHPGKGLIYPTSFIELAEETGLIDALGEWVLTAACNQMRTWLDAGLRPLRMSVNVSAIQLNSERLCMAVTGALEGAQLDPSLLELEITESSLMQNLEAAQAVLGKFCRMGISISIDDFGTGYSSLNYLKRLPIDTLKIDRSFVHDVAKNEDDAAIVRATIAMAHSMRLKVVAEGVTSFDQLHLLQEWQCDEIQGYLFCQPLPAQEVELFFRTAELRGVHYLWTH